ncbi:MAG TPA: class I SAM-dependent methyltransferase, partial [Gaiellaceae bacterium]
MTEGSAYSFGDSELAAERLALVARVFEPAMRKFLERAAPRRPQLALDLGCGPGHTTETVAALTCPERTVGLDVSEQFLEHARKRAGSRIEFVRH